ncbi:MAG: Coenzyme F420 hydrogenase/dehydrogenase, beta subunit C-terminal domain [Desulfotomaculaceae bacterium]|nr:Coenzyme F420 hydrogenase/dehydrogenase, beta subunit C-terminal domain [Desulfotomaculaceae bacterium]
MDNSTIMQCDGAARLQKEVLDRGLCTVCGACVGYCPYIKTFGEQVAVIHDCKICDGVCYRLCPRGFTDYEGLRQSVFGSMDFDPVLGTHTALYYARAKSEKIRAQAQYGGIVTALSLFALQQGLIDSSLMAGGGPTDAQPFLCSTSKDIFEMAGSKFTAVPTLSLFQEAVKNGFQRVGVVGRPCQVTACRKMQQVEEINGQRIALVIGLFCFWSLSAEFHSFVKERGLANCTHMGIPKDNVNFRQENGSQITMPLEEIRHLIKETCKACYDPLSELADVSVGSTEQYPGWNTLVVRTNKGKQLVADASTAGIIELQSYPLDRLPVLRQAVFQKKKRVLERPDTAYIGVPTGERNSFVKGGEV